MGGREGGKEGEREGEREGGRGREGEREGERGRGREGGREGGRKGEREGGREGGRRKAPACLHNLCLCLCLCLCLSLSLSLPLWPDDGEHVVAGGEEGVGDGRHDEGQHHEPARALHESATKKGEMLQYKADAPLRVGCPSRPAPISAAFAPSFLLSSAHNSDTRAASQAQAGPGEGHIDAQE